MRVIGKCQTQDLAQRFLDYLRSLGIPGEVRPASTEEWAVWVYSEDHRERAGSEFRQYLAAPQALQYVQAPATAAVTTPLREAAPVTSVPRRLAETRDALPAGISLIDIPVTVSLIAISVGVAIISNFGAHETAIQPLLLTAEGLARGEAWRLLTPVFIHFGFLHVFFNMLWLRQLGGMIERTKGRWFLLVLVLLIGALSNSAQFFMHGALFGGMSGVVYGLFGYVWMRMRYTPESGLEVDPTTVALMLVWFVLCMSGLVGPVASWAHGVGLLVGVIFGIIPALFRRLKAP
jgi:GlpG protein